MNPLSAFTRRLMLACSFVVGACTLSPHASAQMSAVHARIPFAFHNATQTFAPGDYLVKYTSNNMILLSSTATGQVAFAMTLDLQSSDRAETGKLVFHRYGDEYFLNAVWLPHASSGRKLMMGREERQICGKPSRRSAPGTEIALNIARP